MNDGHVRDVYLQEVVPARSPPQLRHSLDERHALDVAHGSSELDYADIRLLARIINWYPRDPLNPVLDAIRDVWDDLHRLAQVITLTLALDDMLVHLAGRDIVVAGQGDVQVALVVSEIEVDLAAVRENKDFPMPARA